MQTREDCVSSKRTIGRACEIRTRVQGLRGQVSYPIDECPVINKVGRACGIRIRVQRLKANVSCPIDECPERDCFSTGGCGAGELRRAHISTRRAFKLAGRKDRRGEVVCHSAAYIAHPTSGVNKNYLKRAGVTCAALGVLKTTTL